VVNQHIYPSVPYDAEKDLAPVSVVVKLPMVLVAHPTAPYNTLQEMIAYARQNPGKLNYASGGSGSIQHLAAELLKSVAGVPIVHIPYRGVALAITDVLANQVPVMFAGFPTALQHVKSGKLKALGVTSTARMAQAPTLPTIAEQGYAGYEVVQWFGLFAPAGTPGELVSRLNADLRAVLAMPDVAANLNGQGATPSPTSPDDFSKFIKAESAKYGLLVKATGIKAD
jgi:tripartite-type tricarboxylate transporter receptor subunit TctC